MGDPKVRALGESEDDAPSATGTRLRMGQDREALADDASLARRVAQVQEIHEGVVAMGALASEVGKGVKGSRWIIGVLAAAIAGAPVLGTLLPDSRDQEMLDQLEQVQRKLDEGKIERRALAGWLWDLERCRRGEAACPDRPPAPVRVMLAQDEIEKAR